MPPVSTITPEERTKRETAVRNSIANARLEGQQLTPDALAIFQRYVEGELTLAGLGQAMDERHERLFPRTPLR